MRIMFYGEVVDSIDMDCLHLRSTWAISSILILSLNAYDLQRPKPCLDQVRTEVLLSDLPRPQCFKLLT